MKPYGIPREKDREHPDKADIKHYEISTPDRCSRKDRGKVTTKRIWKKRE